MAKIGILTFHYANNYGAVLQAYGLAKAIEAIGHDVELLDYRPLVARRAYDRWWRHPRKIISSLLIRSRFNHFRRRYLPLSLRPLWTIEDLSCSSSLLDCVVCGSDQVWNISSYRGYDPAFFLGFLDNPGPRRVSYAASFGQTDDLGEHRQQIQGLLTQFDMISVRDIKSHSMTIDLISRAPVHVLDPTFLINYDSITPSESLTLPYILIYSLGKTYFFAEAVRRLQKLIQMPFISIQAPFDCVQILKAPGPSDWLGLMRHAAFICTDSYHGVCFSLINHKPFVALPPLNGLCRLTDLLQNVDLIDRVVLDENEIETLFKRPIDYQAVDIEIDRRREISYEYLRSALD